jgi:hypothetical protein
MSGLAMRNKEKAIETYENVVHVPELVVREAVETSGRPQRGRLVHDLYKK